MTGSLVSGMAVLESPLRGESFSAEHLWSYAQQLAESQIAATRLTTERPLIDRFASNAQFIAKAYKVITESVRKGEPLAPDAEWLVDNYYVVEEQLREIREDLPRSFYRELPKLASPPWEGFPRVYELAYELVVHTDSCFDEELIVGFVSSYQQATPLTSGEVWAIPIMLRLVLVENLRRISAHMLAARTCRLQARQLLAAWDTEATSIRELGDLPGCSMLVTELIDCVRSGDFAEQGIGLHELAERLGQPQESLDECVRHEQQRLASNQVSIGNLITSMRLISALDWSLFFERVSLVEHILRQDPPGIYARMDFATRDEYRHVIEKLAKRCKRDETDVALAALGHALAESPRADGDMRRSHVGYYLVGDGCLEVERELKYRPSVAERIGRAVRRFPALVYLGGVALFTVLLDVALVAALRASGASATVCIVASLLAAIPASELAVGLVNALVTIFLRPRMLPKLEFLHRIPADCRTLVAMPVMLTSEENIRSLLERLEIHYLANPEPGIGYALLTDFVDAPSETMADDEALVALAQCGIDALNDRYCDDEQPRFYHLHRHRVWNPIEGVWMGWERKRGKLLELNRLLRGRADVSYVTGEPVRKSLRSVRYVITLDSDTRLPHAAARRLIGALAHPLNCAHFSDEQRRVTRGYGVLQPRVSVSLASGNQSFFSRIFANSGGLDPYCTAVSDVYQDLFGEGSYTGKGIYDVDAFSAAVDDSFPENHILSHDLIEGCFARVGLATDIELFDEYPSRYDVDVRRHHRWIRGDWQLLPWLWPRVPSAAGPRPNPLTIASRWRVFDNLRRSLAPLMTILLLACGWFFIPQHAWLFACAAGLVLLGPLVTTLLTAAVHWPRGEHWREQARETLIMFGRVAIQCLIAVAFLPHKAYYSTDAIVRTLYRMFVSRKRRLEWETSDSAERRLSQSAWSSFRQMGWVTAASLLVAAALPAPARWSAVPFLLGWLFSPAIAVALSRRAVKVTKPLSHQDREQLRRIARKTWAFFEVYVGPDDNWLPPDNFQEFPKPKIAHRLSPTNEGLFIVSAVAAHDFGYIGKWELVNLLERNLESLDRLPRYRGHFYNWYITTTLAPLGQRYISTVDSGNLAACFLTAEQGLADLVDEPLFDAAIAHGAIDAVDMVQESIARLQPRGARFVSPALDAFERKVAELRNRSCTRPKNPLGWSRFVHELRDLARELPQQLRDFEESIRLSSSEVEMKVRLLVAQIDSMGRDVDAFLPWTESLEARPSEIDQGPEWSALMTMLTQPLTLNQAAAILEHVQDPIRDLRRLVAASDNAEERLAWIYLLETRLADGARHAEEFQIACHRLRERYESFVNEMDFTMLYDSQRRLFSVGYNLEDGRPDRAHYDLLASEARIASLVAVATGDVDHRHWFQLSRAMTEAMPGERCLLSWGGTMFEFLMPGLFTRDVPGSLLDQTCQAAVARQIAYGKQRGVPWGISESAFGALATNSDYHYQSFGVPGLGLKSGLGKDLVIAPYASALAVTIEPAKVAANFRDLAKEGAAGQWGFYDAIDYTPERLPANERRIIVFCYMAHHQGMTLVALANGLLNHCMQRRFQSQPLARSVELLLQERIPIAVLQFQPQESAAVTPPPLPAAPGPVSRRIITPHTDVPRTHLLSNGQYTVMVTNAGGGYSSCRDLAITRWRPDLTRDDCGQFIYLRDVATNRVWSAAHHPIGSAANNYEVTFSVDKAEFRRRDGSLETHVEITISPENNAEVRQLTVTNHGPRPVTIEATSYAEIVLSAAAADAAHPAFSKLFIETEYVADCHAILARRRPRDADTPPLWAAHILASATPLGSVEWETDRASFLGRGRTPANPAAMDANAKLSGTTGPVLDPVFSLRGRLQIGPDESASLAYITAFADTREEAMQLADQYRDPRVIQRTFEMSWAHSQVERRHLHASPAEIQLFQRLASPLLYPDASLRAPAEILEANRLGQRSLWRYGISGDEPIVLVRVSAPTHRTLLREVLLAQEFWNTHGLKVDLVIVNEHAAGYFDEFQEQLVELVHSTARMPFDKPGGVYLLRVSQLTIDDFVLLQAVAAISLHGDRGPLAQQAEGVAPPSRKEVAPLQITRSASDRPSSEQSHLPDLGTLEFYNGLSGFTAEGDYAIRLKAGEHTPRPWSNVIANPQFGFLVTESGGGYTWAGNSRENKLTTWSNDPIVDSPSEIIYLRDEETGQVWTPTPLLSGDDSDYLVVHRRGSTAYYHGAHGIRSELVLAVAPQSSIKFACLKLRNDSNEPRSLSTTMYAEWVLGVHRPQTQMHTFTARDDATGALLARNPYHEDYPAQIAFLHVLGRADSVTGDRTEFLGRNGSERDPAALRRLELSGTTGAGFDPCGAVQKKLQLAPGEEAEVIFLLGWTDGKQPVAEVILDFQTPEQIRTAIDDSLQFWRNLSTAIEVQTPNRAFDVLVNHWLQYQILSCRVWGRSAFYQSGGAYGFRDQLQDSMALVASAPDIARQTIMLAASRQFEQGDVQHWWHPPAGRGVRTRFADDYLWLPFVTAHYVTTTGDSAILDEMIPFLKSPLLEPHEHERYEVPDVSPAIEPLYAHCLRAIDHAFRFGPHELPLIGCGDWNDGLNRVGAEGQGESVWMAWFLRVVLQRFLPFVEARGETSRAGIYRDEAEKLLQAAEKHGWDGRWYRRAYFDDGTPLGSAQNQECRLDSLAQSWSVIAGADPDRSVLAMQAVDENLVRAEDRLVLLLAPPFDHMTPNPGYIMGYVPGIRENGGQYTHAAMWVIQALVLQGHGTRAGELFDLVNPILASTDPQSRERYQVEPYVVTADVYGAPPHVGRGGWSWYTGSASWMYQVAVEFILGFKLRGDRLQVRPCVPAHWSEFQVTLRRGQSTWHIVVTNPSGAETGTSEVTVDGQKLSGDEFALVDDGQTHAVKIAIRAPDNPSHRNGAMPTRLAEPDSTVAPRPPVNA